MNITFTGSIIKTTEHKNCIFDGEYVGNDKQGKYINNYLIFDIYFIDKEDVRKFPLIFKEGFKYEKKMENKGRLEIIAKYMKDIKIAFKGKGLNEFGIDKNKKVIIRVSKNYFRPLDVTNLLGDYSKAKRLLNWKPKKNLDHLIDEMIKFDLRNLKKN